MPKANIRPKWFILEQRGGRKDWPLMPAILTLYRIATSSKFTQATGVKLISCLIDIREENNYDYVKSCVREDQWQKFTHQCFFAVKRNPGIQKRLVNEFKKRVPKFLKFCRKVYQSDLSKKTNKEIWHLYKKYISLYEDIYIWGEPFAFGARFDLSKYLKDYLLKKGKERRLSDNEINESFDTLITPKEKPFHLEEEEELLKIALKIEKNHKFRKLFLKSLNQIKQEIQNHPQINHLIEKHTQKWQWIPYNYGAYLFNRDHFLKEISELIRKGAAQEELSDIQKKYQTLAREQKKIVVKFGVDNYHQELFEAMRFNSFIIDYKKKIFTLSHFYINFSLMKEIALRLGIEQKLAHCLLKEEVKDALLNDKMPSPRALNKRYKWSVTFISNGKMKLYSGEEAGKFLKNFNFEETPKEETKEFKGVIAFRGFAKGETKIILSPKDFEKMKKDDILVAHMTTPEYVPIIKKAQAVVTDEGGITSHAAIISRELKIPCIIGTRIATKVLKDGDLVEVDAEKGIIKIL